MPGASANSAAGWPAAWRATTQPGIAPAALPTPIPCCGQQGHPLQAQTPPPTLAANPILRTDGELHRRGRGGMLSDIHTAVAGDRGATQALVTGQPAIALRQAVGQCNRGVLRSPQRPGQRRWGPKSAMHAAWPPSRLWTHTRWLQMSTHLHHGAWLISRIGQLLGTPRREVGLRLLQRAGAQHGAELGRSGKAAVGNSPPAGASARGPQYVFSHCIILAPPLSIRAAINAKHLPCAGRCAIA